MKRLKTKEYSRDHTKQRLLERYGIEISDAEYQELCDQVADKKETTFISSERQKKDIQQIYYIVFKQVTVKLVWSKSLRYIKTVLPI